MKQLLFSGLNVMSMGHCLGNANQKGLLTLHNDNGYNVCKKHRIMLAVENHICDDWISPNFNHALQCGAIPIVYVQDHVPKYPH
eukprot:4772371-Prymnesium_polylepis.1